MKRRIFVGYSVLTPLLAACGGGSAIGNVGMQAPIKPGVLGASPTNPSYSPGVARTLSWDTLGNWAMDSKPFQFFGSELHPCRIPYQHWEQRIKMVRALGCNTMSIYLMWNYHELGDGSFDFETDSRRMGEFIDLCGKHGLWVTVRPGPYVCAEWDFGGLPPRMLADPKFRDDKGVVQIRGNFPAYMEACKAWHSALFTNMIKGRTLKDGGPIMLLALENEYTSYSPIDGQHVVKLAEQWSAIGYTEKFTACDGWADGFKKNNISLPPNCAYGITADGETPSKYILAAEINKVGVYGSECYTSWFANWGEANQTVKLQVIADKIGAIARAGRSCVLYVGHGGTSFGFGAGCNGQPHQEMNPSLTSYDYGSPINEAGGVNTNFALIRDAYIANASYAITYVSTPDQPAAIADAGIATVNVQDFGYAGYFDTIAQFKFSAQTNVMGAEWMAWTLNKQAGAGSNVYPSGLSYYETVLPKSGNLTLEIENAPDMALVFVNGKLARAQPLSTQLQLKAADGPNVPGKPTVVQLPLLAVPANAKLHIACMPFGRVNFQTAMRDEFKGLSGGISLVDGSTSTVLTGWSMGLCELKPADLNGFAYTAGLPLTTQPFVARANFNVNGAPADAYLDMSPWGQGYVFVNGHNLGRFWSARGPQTRLYCPAEWLLSGQNTLHVLEFTAVAAAPVRFFGSSNLPYSLSTPVIPALVPETGTVVQLQNVNNGYVLDLLASTGTSQALVMAAAQPDVATQWWRVTQTGGGGVMLTNQSNGQILVPAAGQNSHALTLVAAPSGTDLLRPWQARPVSGSGSAFTLQSVPGGLYLDVDQASKSSTSVQSGALQSGPVLSAQLAEGSKAWPFSQQWRFVREELKTDKIYSVQNLFSKLYLTTFAGSGGGAPLAAQANASGKSDQHWKVLIDANKNINMTHVDTGLILETQDGGTSNGTPIDVGIDGASTGQRFTPVQSHDGYSYTLIEVLSGLALDMNGSSTKPTDGAGEGVITLWESNSGQNQSWVFVPVG